MKNIFTPTLLLLLSFSLVSISGEAAPNKDVSRITMEEVKSMLDDPDVIILDVRPDEQWNESSRKFPGAVHENAEDVKSWAKNYSKDKTLILY